MNTQIIKLFIIILSSVFLLSSLSLAGGKSKGKHKTNPPGWEQGEKTGWKGEDTPPGLTEEKLEKKQKAKMKQDKSKAKNKSEKAKDEAEVQKEKVEQEAEIDEEKKEREAELKKEKKKMKSNSKDKKG